MQLPDARGLGTGAQQLSFLDNEYYQQFSDEILAVRDVASLLEETRVSTLKRLVSSRARPPHSSAEGPAPYRSDAREQSLRAFLELTSRPVAQVPRPKSAALARLQATHRAALPRPETSALRGELEGGNAPADNSALAKSIPRRPRSAPTHGAPKSQLGSAGPLRVDVVDNLWSRGEVGAGLPDEQTGLDESSLRMGPRLKSSDELKHRCVAGIHALLYTQLFAT